MNKTLIWTTPKNTIWHLISFSTVSFLLYASYFSSQNIIVEIYDQFGFSSLGNYTLLSCFVGNSLTAIISPGILKYISFKHWFFLSGVGVLMIQLSCVFTYYCSQNTISCSDATIYLVNIIFGFIVGIGNVWNWISQCGYITNISTYNTKSFFFSMFFIFFMGSFMISSVITIIVLDYSQSQVKFFIFALLLSALATFLYLFISDVPINNFIKNPEKDNFERIKDILSLFSKKIKNKLTFLSFFIGIEVGFYLCFLYTLIEETVDYVSNVETNIKTAYVLVVLGIFEMFGGILSSCLGDRIKKIYLLILGFVSIGFGFIFVNLILFVDKNYLFCFFLGGGMGFGDCILQSMVNAIISCEENDIENFAHYMALQSLGSLITVLFSVLLPNYVFLTFIFVSYVLCFVCILILK